MKDKEKQASKSGKEPAFIRPLEGDGEQVQVSFRIGVLEKERFEAAQGTLRKHGKEMPLVDVLRTSLRDASEYVERRYRDNSAENDSDRAKSQGSGGSKGATKKTVEDSSRHAVEESWSSSVFDGQSETLEDQPLTGSRATGKESSGVGFAAKGDRDGAR